MRQHHASLAERIVSAGLIGLMFGLMAALLIARGDQAGVDAHAYWGAVNRWLAGEDPLDPPQGFLPYLYAPWLLIAFLPWAILPWSIAWPVWRALNVAVLAVALGWAYRRRPVATTVVVGLLWLPLIVTLDTGNVTLLLAMSLWAAQRSGPFVAGALWALATSMKWYPVLVLGLLSRRARRWGVALAAGAVLLSLLMWPQTVAQVRAVLADPRPSRIDYLLLGLAFVPWLWRHEGSVVVTLRQRAVTLALVAGRGVARLRPAGGTVDGDAVPGSRAALSRRSRRLREPV